MAGDLDYALALSLQDQFNREAATQQHSGVSQSISSHNNSSTQSPLSLLEYNPRKIVDGSWEFMDPNPNIHNLFVQFDQMFFNGTLVSRGVAVSWSNRMTLCAGVCSYRGREGFCSIRLSEKLLKLRPRRDLVQTLLHEMIHAYLFVTHNNTDHNGHGPNFQAHMHRINDQTGTKITIYHTFHDEVMEYKKHWWKCNGPCQNRSPFFGTVHRAMNRAPSHHDPWWTEHQKTCGGTYLKIKEPEGYKKQGENKTKVDTGHILNGKKTNSRGKPKTINTDQKKKIDDMFPKINTKTEIDLTSVNEDSERKLLDTSVSDRRSKTLAAAERRLTGNEMRGKGVKRLLAHTSKDVDHGSSKKTKLAVVIDSGSKKGQASSATASPVLKVCDISTPTIVDLCEDGFDCSPKPILSTSSQVQSDNKINISTEVVLIEDPLCVSGLDDDVLVVEGKEFRTCPVCGMNTIPAAIINAHVAFCLEEDDWEKIND